jgi:hypothetical protein
MAGVLAYTSPTREHLFPLTPILDELSRRGHSVAVRTVASQGFWRITNRADTGRRCLQDHEISAGS